MLWPIGVAEESSEAMAALGAVYEHAEGGAPIRGDAANHLTKARGAAAHGTPIEDDLVDPDGEVVRQPKQRQQPMNAVLVSRNLI